MTRLESAPIPWPDKDALAGGPQTVPLFTYYGPNWARTQVEGYVQNVIANIIRRPLVVPLLDELRRA